LTDFRNYRELRLSLAAAPVVLTGANGAGKTNLLEALSLLAPGRGLRGARLGDVARRRPDAAEGAAWAVAATVEGRRGSHRLGTGRDGATGERRVVHVDGEPVRGHAALAEALGILWLTPAMDRLFLESPGGRRRFLDRLVFGFDPAHAARVGAYEQALRERSRLLRDGPADRAWLTAVEGVMAKAGAAVAAARRDVVEQLDDACAAAEGPFPRARLQLSGAVEGWLGEMPALAAEERFAASLAESRHGDSVSGGAAVGPHRTDLAVMHAEKGIAAETASTGEQKALLIAIVLADARLLHKLRGEPPLLLLDEVAAHLDPKRRAALFEALLALDGQAWLTGTEPAVFAPLAGAAQFLTVHDGRVHSTEF
jgi:DNA replication and repair protein RecF